MKKLIEKRRTERLKVPLQVEYRFSAKRKTLVERIFANNISGGGIGLILDKPIALGTRLKTLIYFPNDAKPIEIISKVVWCQPKTRNSFSIGIKHIRIKPKDRERFIFLFCETMINYFLLPSRVVIYAKKRR